MIERKLTKKQEEILRLFVGGMSVKEIAEKQGISKSTVLGQLRQAALKLGKNSHTELRS